MLLRSEDLLEFGMAELTGSFHNAVVLLRACVLQDSGAVLFHPRSKSSLTVFSGRVRATECENEVDGLRHRLAVNLLMPVREASPLGLEGFDEWHLS